jgi:NADPH-dependent 7-cyano-7-deazaguanine reductase QueF-like protein
MAATCSTTYFKLLLQLFQQANFDGISRSRRRLRIDLSDLVFVPMDVQLEVIPNPKAG